MNSEARKYLKENNTPETRKMLKRITREPIYQDLRQRALAAEARHKETKERLTSQLAAMEAHAHKLEETIKAQKGQLASQLKEIEKMESRHSREILKLKAEHAAGKEAQ
jgi:hypothetical protein